MAVHRNFNGSSGSLATPPTHKIFSHSCLLKVFLIKSSSYTINGIRSKVTSSSSLTLNIEARSGIFIILLLYARVGLNKLLSDKDSFLCPLQILPIIRALSISEF